MHGPTVRKGKNIILKRIKSKKIFKFTYLYVIESKIHCWI